MFRFSDITCYRWGKARHEPRRTWHASPQMRIILDIVHPDWKHARMSNCSLKPMSYQGEYTQKTGGVKHADELLDNSEIVGRHPDPSVERIHHRGTDLFPGYRRKVGIRFDENLLGMCCTRQPELASASENSQPLGEGALGSTPLTLSESSDHAGAL